MRHDDTFAICITRPFLRLLGIIFAALFASAVAGTAVAGPMFVAPLEGTQEVPPVVTDASGVARFEFNDALTEMTYSLEVFDISNVTMAHIHLAPLGVNGPVILWLYPSAPPAELIPGLFNGLLASRTVTAADLVGLLAGESLTALYDEMVAGNTYVNVHTRQFPGGEIRGQIQRVSEPGTMVILGLGLAALAVMRRRRTV